MDWGSGLAATLPVPRQVLVTDPPDFWVDGLCASYKSGVRRRMSPHSPMSVSLSGGVFSRPTRARIRTLVGMSATDESGVPSGKLEQVYQRKRGLSRCFGREGAFHFFAQVP